MMKLNPVLKISESDSIFNLSFINEDEPFATFKKGRPSLTEYDYQPLIDRIGKSKGLHQPYLEDNLNHTILKLLLGGGNKLSRKEVINLSNQLNSLHLQYSTLKELSSIDTSVPIDWLFLDIRSCDKLPVEEEMVKLNNIDRIVFVNFDDREYLVGPLVKNSNKICLDCLIASVISYRNRIIFIERNETKNILETQVLEFLLYQNSFDNYLVNGQMMIKSGNEYKTSYRVPFDEKMCKRHS